MKTSPFILIIVLITICSCSKNNINKVSLEDKHEFKSAKAIDFSEEVGFKPHTGEVIINDSLALTKLIDFLKENQTYNVNLQVSHTFGSERFYKEGLLKSGNLKDFLVSHGIEPDRISYNTFLDTKNKYKYDSIYRKVLIEFINN